MSILESKMGALAVALGLLTAACIVKNETVADDDATTVGSGGSGATGGAAGVGGSGAGQPADDTQLFVVNNNAELTSYVGANTLQGELPPTTRLSLGASTSLFQPRAAVITSSGRLLVARQNGGIVGYDEGISADGETEASVVVEGTNTQLGSPVAFAYQTSNDLLYVGAPQMENGVIAFTGVSAPGFSGDVAPARAFGPSDRAPYDTTGTILMSVDAMVLDSTGSLFFSDTSGDNVNNSRVLFYDAPAALDGMADPDAVITSTAWGTIEDMAIDAAGTLYVVNASNMLFVYDNADTLTGEVQPTRTVTIGVSLASLTGVTLSSTGLGYLADDENHSIYSIDSIATQDGSIDPNRILDGFETRLRNPRKMFLLEP